MWKQPDGPINTYAQSESNGESEMVGKMQFGQNVHHSVFHRNNQVV